jgi:hypothetical protein
MIGLEKTSCGRAIRVAIVSALLPVIAVAQPTLHTTVLPIYQVGNGAGVHLGHIVSASTAFNRLLAGGTFVASCAHPDMQPARGQRTLSADNYGGGLRMDVTIPAVLPATVAMPGFYSLTRGTTVYCTYEWTSRAVEGGFTVGAGGVTFQTGNGEKSEGFFQQFQMSVPGDTNTDDWQGCIP